MVGTEKCLARSEHFGLSPTPVLVAGILFDTEEHAAYLYVLRHVPPPLWSEVLALGH